MSINVIINGIKGKMGQVTEQAIQNAPDLTLVGGTDEHDDLRRVIKEANAHVVVDFTVPDAVFANTMTILDAGACPVIGTTGFTLAQIDIIRERCQQEKKGAIIAPNFSIGALLMMQFAQQAAKYFEQAEIIELHHPLKKDAPSGTAKKTAEMMAEAKQQSPVAPCDAKARGEEYCGIPIHSVRLPSLFAHQSVMFGGPGETFILTHNAMSREAMMPGVVLACKKVVTLNQLVYGLEHLVFSG